MAHSVSSEASPKGFASEFERLAQRSPTEVELAIAQRASDKCSVWAEGLRPESLAFLALALSSAEDLKILFVSPTVRLLAERQTRLGTRSPCIALGERSSGADVGLPLDAGLTVWAAPNQLQESQLTRLFASTGPDLVFIEDLHAASSEAFSFRPSFEGIKDLLAQWPQTRVIASSAHLDEKVKRRIGTSLGVPGWSTLRGLRESLCIEDTFTQDDALVLRVERDEKAAIAALIGPLARPALVLCGTPAQADAVYAELEEAQVPVHRFHSGVPAGERAKELVHFALPGRRAIMIAVSAFGPEGSLEEDAKSRCSTHQSASAQMSEQFGLGYGRSDLRSLVHLCAPCSLAQYAQELSLMGVNGRLRTEDHRRENAQGYRTALLHFDPSHLVLNAALLERKRPSSAHLESVVAELLAAPKNTYFDESSLSATLSTSPRQISQVLAYLLDAGALEFDQQGFRVSVGVRELKRIGTLLSRAFLELSAGDPARLLQVEEYATSKGCRVQKISTLLGMTEAPAACGHCDFCAPGEATVQQDSVATNAQSTSLDPMIPTRERRQRKAPARRTREDGEPQSPEEEEANLLEKQELNGIA